MKKAHKPGNPGDMPCSVIHNTQLNDKPCVAFISNGTPIKEADEKKIMKATGATLVEQARLDPGSCITTGSYVADLQSGGGIPPGAVITYCGPSKSGKTTSAMKPIQELLNRGIDVRFHESEGSIEWEHAANMGLPLTYDPETTLWTHPHLKMIDFPHGEAFFQYMRKILLSLPNRKYGPPQIAFVCDSVAALIPEEMAKADGDTAAFALDARMLSKCFKWVKSLLKQKRGVLILTQHMGKKPGVTFGPPEYMKGGEALVFYSDMVIWLNAQATKMPFPGPTKGGKGEAVEKAGVGRGKDRYVYSKIAWNKCKFGNVKNKLAWHRICIAENSGKGSGIALPYNVMQYLVQTGQAIRSAKSGFVDLNIVDLEYDAETERFTPVQLEGLYDRNEMSWRDFKSIVMSQRSRIKSEKSKVYPDLSRLVRKQIRSGWAVVRYHEVTLIMEESGTD